ncbi:hypothetical protein BHE74_00017024 [Ensete ventricosum]|nr:hypothetical protein BHE74_00017024 [Ensete ventricosum]
MRSQSWLVDIVHMNLMHDLLKAGSGRSGSGASTVVVLSPVATPVVVHLAPACSPSEVQEIPPKEPSRKVPESSRKHRSKTSSSQRKKSKVSDRHKSHNGGEKSRPQAVEDEKSDPPNERTSDARPRLKSIRELCRGHPEVDGRDFHAIRVCSQSEHVPDTALVMDLTPLTHETHVWVDGEASTKHVQGTQFLSLASDLYNLSSKILMDQATKFVVLMALIDRVHDVDRVITSLGEKMDGLRKEVQRLKDRSNPDAVVATEQRASEAQSLADHLKAKLEEATQRWESLEKELGEIWKILSDSWDQLSEAKKQLFDSMGLVRMGRVSMEYGYQLALARFRARYLDFGVEEDPFKELPEDTIVPIVTEQPFDDSPPPPEE